MLHILGKSIYIQSGLHDTFLFEYEENVHRFAAAVDPLLRIAGLKDNLSV